jgi:hypothetical protein
MADQRPRGHAVHHSSQHLSHYRFAYLTFRAGILRDPRQRSTSRQRVKGLGNTCGQLEFVRPEMEK